MSQRKAVIVMNDTVQKQRTGEHVDNPIICSMEDSILLLGENDFQGDAVLEINSYLLDESILYKENAIKTSTSTNEKYITLMKLEEIPKDHDEFLIYKTVSDQNRGDFSFNSTFEKFENQIDKNLNYQFFQDEFNSGYYSTDYEDCKNYTEAIHFQNTANTHHRLSDGITKGISYQQDGMYQEVLDLSIPKRREKVDNRRKLKRIFSGTGIRKNELNVYNEIPKRKSNNGVNQISIEEETGIPEDLPDLRNSFILPEKSSSERRTRYENWVYSVRRRTIPLAIVRKMFGLEDNYTSLTLVADGLGIRNPLEWNIPRSAIRPDKEGMYTCPYCDMSWKQRKGLMRHLMGHTTFKQYFCVICWKGFYDSHDLKRHSSVHIDVKVFYCAICTAIFTQNVTKEDHFSKIHNIQLCIPL